MAIWLMLSVGFVIFISLVVALVAVSRKNKTGSGTSSSVCPYCQARINHSHKYCHNCGARLDYKDR